MLWRTVSPSSWLPANAEVRTRALLPERGHNFALQETLDIVIGDGEHVSMWGPYRIDERLYNGAVRKYAQLESGEVRYKCIDSGHFTDRVCNCIHAVSTAVDGDRPYVLSPGGFGDGASWAVLRKFRRYLIDRDETQEWVYSYLGLENYPIHRRDFGHNPSSGVFMGLLRGLLTFES